MTAAFVLAASTARTAHAEHPLPFDAPANRNWSRDSDTLFVSVDKGDLAQKTQGAKHLWSVLSARSLLPELWKDPANGTPEFTERCVLQKDYDFTWIEATEVPLASAKGDQIKVMNAAGAYYAFVLVEKADGSLAEVNVTKLGNAERNPPHPGAVEIRNGQTLSRTWDDDKRHLCGQRGAKAPAALPAEAPMVRPLPFDESANRNWSTGAETINLTVDKADLAAKLKDAKRAFVVLSARALLREWWTDPGPQGVPRVTHTCAVNKQFDFKWIEATEVPIAKLTGDQLKITNATGTYYAFVLVEKADGRYADVRLAKLGDTTRDPLKLDALVVRNGQTLARGTWDDDKKPLCK